MQEFTDQMPSDIELFPMVPIRDVVIFPYSKVAFKIGRAASVMALERAMEGERHIFLATQHDATIDEPAAEQVFSVGTIGRIAQAQRLDNGQIKVVVEGSSRGYANRVVKDEHGMFHAYVRRLASTEESGYRTDGLLQKIHSLIENLMRMSADSYTDALSNSLRGTTAGQIADSMSSQLKVNVSDKQLLLETTSVPERLSLVIEFLEAEVDKRNLDRDIHARTKKAMDKHQREYYLNEQIKAIHQELGRKDEKAELEEMKQKVLDSGMTDEAREKALQEFQRPDAEHGIAAGTILWKLARILAKSANAMRSASSRKERICRVERDQASAEDVGMISLSVCA
jgi:ATP-dependent Lon protease